MSPADTRRIEEAEHRGLMAAALESSEVVGCALCVVRRGGSTTVVNQGSADRQRAIAVGDGTVFRLASVSKVFTSVGVLQLVERGLIGLDDPVAAHLRSIAWRTPAGMRPATVRDVLTHTAGVPDVRWTDFLRWRTAGGLGVQEGKRLPEPPELLRRGITPEVAPGVKWAYSNVAMTALGQMVSDVTGQRFGDYMRVAVFDALGMRDTTFDSRRGPAVAAGYALRRGRLRPVPRLQIAHGPAGGAEGTVADLGRFAAAIIGGGANEHGRVLAPATMAQMTSSQWTADPRLRTQGLGFLLEQLVDETLVWHDGAFPGFTASLVVAPARGVGAAFVNNSFSPLAHRVTDTVVRHHLQLPQLTDTNPTTDRPLRPVGRGTPPAGRYKPPAGRKTNLRSYAGLGGRLTVTQHHGSLRIRSRAGAISTPTTLTQDPHDPLLFTATVRDKREGLLPLRLVFILDHRGAITGLACTLYLPFQLERRTFRGKIYRRRSGRG